MSTEPKNYKQIQEFEELNSSNLHNDDKLLIQDHTGVTKYITAKVLNEIKENMLFYEVLDDEE